MGWAHRLRGYLGIGVCQLVGEICLEARASSMMVKPGDSGAGVCPLLGGTGFWGLWLQGPGGPGSSACTLMCGSWSWALWWTGVAMGSGCWGVLDCVCLLVDGAVA